MLKRLLAMLLCLGLSAVLGLGTTGCGKPKEKDKDAKKDKDKDKTDKTTGKDTTLKVSGPKTAVAIKVGKSGEATVKFERGKDIKDVALKVDVPAASKGITATIAPAKLGDKTEATVSIDVGKTATAGKHVLTVTSTPDPGEVNKIEVTVEVEAEGAPPAKKELSISEPKDVTAKQGETANASVKVTLKDLASAALKVEVKNDKDKDVKDADVKVTAPAKVEASGDVKVTIVIGAEAAPGDYVATITATAEGATAATAKLNIKVEKK